MRKSIRKIIAIASASVMALTFAVTSAPNASAGTISKAAKEAAKAAFDASGKTTYHAYFGLQQTESWIFRDEWYQEENGLNGTNLPDGAYYVGSEEKKAGIMQMEYLAEKMGGKGNIVILMGKLDNEGTIKRTEGVEEIAKKYPDIKILDKQTGLWQRTDGMAKTENWLNKYGNEINAIVSNNDDMALGAVQALKDSGKTGIFVIGVDATPDGLAALAAGDISATVFQDADGQGGGAVEVAKKAANGETVVKETWVPFKLVTPENINEFKK